MLKRVTKKVMVAALAVMMLFGMPTLDVGASYEPVEEQIYEPVEEQIYEDILPMQLVRTVRMTRVFNRAGNTFTPCPVTPLIPAGVIVTVMYTFGNFARVSGGNNHVHMRWLPIVDLGF